MSDAINPSHYKSESGIECIDAIRASMTLDEFIAHCRGTAIKYSWRTGKKDPKKAAEDLRKGAWYLERAAKEIELAEGRKKLGAILDYMIAIDEIKQKLAERAAKEQGEAE